MRKLMVIALMCSLVLVTSLPNVAVASTCAMPQDAGMKMAQSSAMHHHGHALTMGDWQTSRIECGCGCHRHLDCMPHVLAPHLLSCVYEQGQQLMSLAAMLMLMQPLVRAPSAVPLPPPIIL